ncbi:MAG: DUF4091 domain-containing protein [Thermofilaceae archaeon]|nr:DUF4091 domain-containing protein [Thermofilaceae archaeon]MCX8180130.1 DUF4091 domain-containing protein [Thermofilaceae archaeon]MDW8004214.1 DUF4091 domain-containing protein [Thermofilaceae archaeon]
MSKLLIWPARPLERIYKDTPPSRVGEPLRLSCLRNEYEGCMFGLRAEVNVEKVRLQVSDLKSEVGTISSHNVQAHFVGSIPLAFNSPAPLEELERKAPCEVPDPILEAEEMDLQAGVTQPCYLRVYVPSEAEPGEYEGFVKAEAPGVEARLKVEVRVHPLTLPRRRSLYVTNWFSVEDIARVHGVELYSDDFWVVFGRWVKFMAEYGQNVFWVPLDTVRVYASEEGYRFDFSIFDDYVETLLKNGAELIEITHVAGFKRWGGREIELRSFKVIQGEGSFKSEPGERVLPHMLKALETHLREKGWLERTVIHVADEPTEDGIEEWRRVSRIVKEHAPQLRRIDAVETTGFDDDLEIWVPTLHHYDQWLEEYEEARRRGRELWFYTCLNPQGRYPNRFIDFPLIKTRILHWINMAYGLRGFLHWGYNWWYGNPFKDLNPNLPPGDTHIVYPGREGPLPSLRLEAMRDGLEDYELFKLLEEEILFVKRELGGKALKLPFERRALELCRKAMPSITGYIRDPRKLIELREEVINEIQEVRKQPLALLITEPPEWKPLTWGPLMVLVRGVCEEGTEVEVNGKPVPVEDGYFATYAFPGSKGEITVKLKKNGFEKVILRRFQIVE